MRDDVHRVLRTRAAAAGLSLSDYAVQELERVAQHPPVADVIARARGPSESGVLSPRAIRAIRYERRFTIGWGRRQRPLRTVPRLLAIALAVGLTTLALVTRWNHIDALPFDFAGARQYHSANVARAYYIDVFGGVPDWKKRVARANLRVDPPIEKGAVVQARGVAMPPLMTAVISASNPARSRARTVSCTGKVAPLAPPHSTAMRRSVWYKRFCTLGQVRVCTATPRPRVM